MRCIYDINGGCAGVIVMTLFLYPETQYSHSVVFFAEEKVAQLEEKKAFCFHKKEQTLKSFAFSQLNVIFLLNLRGKTGEDSWVHVTATQLGSSY